MEARIVPIFCVEDELRKALQELADAIATHAANRTIPAIDEPALVKACGILYADRIPARVS